METLGILFFFLIFGMAFWLLVFLIGFISVWVGLLGLEKLSPSLVNNWLSKDNSEE